MTDKELLKEIQTLLKIFPYDKWKPMNWQMDPYTNRRLMMLRWDTSMVNINPQTRETELAGYPIHLVYEPIGEVYRETFIPTEQTARLDEFFVLSLVGKSLKLGRTYYLNSEKCIDLVVSEAPNGLVVKLT